MGIKPQKYLLASLFLMIILISDFAYTKGGSDNGIKAKVWQALKAGKGDTPDRVARLGKDAVPILIGMVRSGEFDWPASIIEALGKIGDKRATPLLLEMLSGNFVYKSKHRVTNGILLRALYQIGDSRAEDAVLKVYEDTKEKDYLRLLAAKVLYKIGSPDSRNKVKELVNNLRHLYEKLFDSLDEEALKELEKMGFDNNEVVLPALADFYLEFRDVALLTKALRRRQLDSPGGRRIKEATKILAEIGTPQAIEVLLKLAENDKSMLPPVPKDANEKYRKQLESVPYRTRLAAAEALLMIKDKVDKKRLEKIIDDILKIALPMVQRHDEKMNWIQKKIGQPPIPESETEESKLRCQIEQLKQQLHK